jgi:hypothetical protein
MQMINDTYNHGSAPRHSDASRSAMMVSSVLHLMSSYAAGRADGPRPTLASSIQKHLDTLAGSSDLAPVMRATCQQLAEHWSHEVRRSATPVKKISLLQRLAAHIGWTPGHTGQSYRKQ